MLSKKVLYIMFKFKQGIDECTYPWIEAVKISWENNVPIIAPLYSEIIIKTLFSDNILSHSIQKYRSSSIF